jgi:hypothetical protein
MKEMKKKRDIRHEKIEQMFSLIKELVEQGKIDEALNLRVEADKLRVYWKQRK